ncbi:MAG: sigma-70 family RNA polymerase sigma factor [Ignavibacteriales bacterium]|nr:sigma-70 family RNA polymerase sigma factor [Ignavibacteriales bacterium]
MIKSLRYKIILQQFKNKVYSYSYYILRNRMDAEDVTQEVLLILWQNIEDINLNAVKTWIMRTTYNKCIDYLRKRNVMFRKEEYLDDDQVEFIRDSSGSQQPDILFEKKLLQSKVLNAIDKLSEEQKHILVLYEIQGMKYREISEIMKIPINTIKVYILRARQNLLKELKREEVFNV